jgi:5-methylcytosine-specific restriction endonuclease McrA
LILHKLYTMPSLGLQDKGSTRRWRKMRQIILIRDSYKCRLCGKRATHVDHIVRRRRGGKDAFSNLRALCRFCNLSRH